MVSSRCDNIKAPQPSVGPCARVAGSDTETATRWNDLIAIETKVSACVDGYPAVQPARVTSLSRHGQRPHDQE